MATQTSSVSSETVRAALTKTIAATDFPELGERYVGKVRDNYLTGDGRRYIVVTDRVSTFDRVVGTIPFKGQVLNSIATWWFEQSKSVVPNHMLREADPNIAEVVECAPLPVEMVMRSYLTGVTSTSIWTHYQNGERTFCGHTLPDGMTFNQKLREPILTPSTKAPQGGHDVSASREVILGMGHISSEDFDVAAEMAAKLFAFGQQLCAERGLILVDTKYEFGKRPDGTIVVIDEIHTPDSSRYWFADSYEERLKRGEQPVSFDKEYLRRWLADQGFKGDGAVPAIPEDVLVESAQRYIGIYEAITGEAFVPNTEAPMARMRRNLGI